MIFFSGCDAHLPDRHWPWIACSSDYCGKLIELDLFILKNVDNKLWIIFFLSFKILFIKNFIFFFLDFNIFKFYLKYSLANLNTSSLEWQLLLSTDNWVQGPTIRTLLTFFGQQISVALKITFQYHLDTQCSRPTLVFRCLVYSSKLLKWTRYAHVKRLCTCIYNRKGLVRHFFI